MLTALFLSTLVIYTGSYDPSSLPKFLILWLSSCLLILPSILALIGSKRSKNSTIFLLGTLVLCTYAIFRAFSSPDVFQAIYGTYPRNNGTLLIILFSFVLIIVLSSYEVKTEGILLKLFLTLGFIECAVGLAQINGFQFVPQMKAYSPVLGTFGNPNQYSAFLGFTLIVCSYMLINFRNNRLYSSFALALIPLALFCIIQTNSIQGLFVFASGLTILLFLMLRTRRLYFFTFLAVVLFLIGISLLGFINKGPLSRLLFQESNISRWEYWRGAISAIRHRPLFGYGPDQFTDAYSLYRPTDAIQRRSTVIVDNAHNWILQIGVTYGLVFLLLILILFSAITYRGLQSSKRMAGVSQVNLVFALWVGFLIQSLISVECSILICWGGLFGAAVLALSSDKEIGKKRQERNFKVRTNRSTRSFSHSFTPLLILICGFVIIFPALSQNALLTKIDRYFSQPNSSYSSKQISTKLETLAPFGNGDRAVWLRIAAIRYQTGDIAETESLLSKALVHFPKEAEITNYLSQLEVNRGNLKSALNYRLITFKQNPRNLANIEEILRISIQLRNKDVYLSALSAYEDVFGGNNIPDDLKWIP